MSTQNRTIIVAADEAEQTERAADLMAERARAAIGERGRFTLALAGGSTVRPIYERFAAAESINWSCVYLFWGDERYVDPANPYSNYRLSKESLIDRIPIPPGNVFAVPTGERNPAAGAKKYSECIQTFFDLKADDLPRFDLIQLGMGPDGHTASLFPHSAALAKRGIAVMNHAGLAPWVDRVTFTFETINHAACVLFIARGAEKATTLHQVLEGAPNTKHRPAGSVAPVDGELIWLLEPAIASQLRGE